MIKNSAANTTNTPTEKPKITFAEMRKRTLENPKTASDILTVSTDTEMKDHKLVFKRDVNTSEFPFWNQINGPLADCFGQPHTDKTNVFTGKVRP